MGLGAYNSGKITGGNVIASKISYNNMTKDAYSAADAQTVLAKHSTVTPVVNDVISFDGPLYTETDMLEAAVIPEVPEVLEEEKGFFESVGDFLTRGLSTGAVVGTSIVSGVANLGEAIVDGAVWTGSKAVEGATWLTAEAVGIVDYDTKKDIMNWREDAKTNVQDFITTEWVNDANKWFYEGTSLGKGINELSAFEYDSKIAQKISKASEDVSRVVLAASLETLTGGLAGPAVAGFFAGTGSSAESNYKKGQISAWDDTQIAMNGAFTSLSWIADAKIGKGLISVKDDLLKNGLKDLGLRTFAAMKNVETYKNAGKFALDAFLTATKKPMSYVNTLFSMGSDIGAYLSGDKELTAANVSDTVISGLGYFILQSLISKSNSYLTEQGKLKVGSATEAENIAKEINNGNKSLNNVLEYNKDAQKQILSSMSPEELAESMKNIKNSQVTKIYDLLDETKQNDLIDHIATKISTDQNLTLEDILLYGNNFTAKVFNGLKDHNENLYNELTKSIGQDVVSGRSNINEVIKLGAEQLDAIKRTLPVEVQEEFVSKINAAKLLSASANAVASNYKTVGGIIDNDDKLETISTVADYVTRDITGDDDRTRRA